MAAELSTAAREAVEVYVQSYERLCELQQIQVASGEPLHARQSGQRSYVARRAIDAELNHPDSPDIPYKLCCPVCTGYMARTGRRA